MTQHIRNGKGHRAYRAKARRLKRSGSLICWLCNDPIDPDLPREDPMSWTADHVIPLAQGGSLTGELRPAHNRCNAARGDGSRELPPLRTSRCWL